MGEGSEKDSDSTSIQGIISSAQKLMADKQFSLASTMLEKAVETYGDSKDIWILYLRLKSQLASSAELLELYKLFHTAVSTCQSYAVIWEVSGPAPPPPPNLGFIPTYLLPFPPCRLSG